MTYSTRGATIVVSIALLATVATQLFYIGVVQPAEDGALLRKLTWTTEAVLFTLVAVAALPLAARSKMPLIWSAIALSGIMNTIQVGMGLLEFPQAQQAEDPQVFQTVLNGAFFLYFHAKAVLGAAAIGLGLYALKADGGLAKALGALTILAGAASAVLNLVGMPNGMEIVFQAGAAGTAATALFAITALVVSKAE